MDTRWQQILQIDPGQEEPLRQRIDVLFEQQRSTWPALRDGEAALSQLKRKTLTLDGESVVVQVNPARRRSTLAKTDTKAIAARPCFLCPENMPTEERGVAFGDFVVLPNPFPILPLHCTIANREHQPQQIAGRVSDFLRLAAAIGPDFAALYNGPRCGASAPDHLHFQSARAEDVPIFEQLPSEARMSSHTSFGRNMLIFRGADQECIQSDLEHAVEALGKLDPESDEPMLNLLARVEAGNFTIVLFPRAAHRPACYFSEGPDQLLISPAILEMCGILVTTEPDHFDQVGANTARSIYAEVSIADTEFGRWVGSLS